MPLSYIRQADLPVATGQPFRPRRLQTPLDRLARRTGGRRSFTYTTRRRGRYVSSRPSPEVADLAVDATLRAAAPHQLWRGRRAGDPIVLATDDFRRKVRVRRAANLVIFLLDASWSMAAAERMVATKGAILSLLLDAYQKRDRVCLVVFQKDRARIALPPTNSVELARRLLAELQVGGRTPLSHGLLVTYELALRERHKDREVQPLLVLLTDGAGNVSLTGRPPEEEALQIASLIRAKGIRAVVINTEHASLDRGLAARLASALGGPCYTLAELRARELYWAVRSELQAQAPSKGSTTT
ncbi:MAG: VWA domain-containing protein [Anaerolineae bacterium]|nr:VWA domain-containing protein [Anaerolineae bacterium]